VDELIRILAPGGVLLVTAPMDFRIHDYPSDYWRLTPSCLTRLFAPLEASIIGWQGLESQPHTVFGIGCKTPVRSRFARGANLFVANFQAWLAQAAAAVDWRRKVKQAVAGPVRSKKERRRWRDFHTARFVFNLPSARRPEPDLVASAASSEIGG
jgi:hypothetical protein